MAFQLTFMYDGVPVFSPFCRSLCVCVVSSMNFALICSDLLNLSQSNGILFLCVNAGRKKNHHTLLTIMDSIFYSSYDIGSKVALFISDDIEFKSNTLFFSVFFLVQSNFAQNFISFSCLIRHFSSIIHILRWK